jgi:arylsulfatase A-like enzyme
MVAVGLVALAVWQWPMGQASVRLSAQTQTARPDRPNVVLIIADDMGYADLSSYGATDVKTPNIDSLARDGVKLTDFYANGQQCTPTRVGLIAGRYQQRYALEGPLPNPGPAGENAERGLRADGRSLPQLLKNGGYATGLVGKWHLGYKPESSPNAHGFDYFFGVKAGYVDYYQHTNGDGLPDLWEQDRPVTVDGYLTDLITERSLRFLEQNAHQPFFLDVSYTTPHYPYQVPDKPSVAADHARHIQPPEPGTSSRADYAAMMERMDRGVGEILRALKTRNLAERTIVIFTNDNGGMWLSNGGPLFNRKGTVWEGGIRVPALIRWPGHIKPGSVSGQVGITMDLTTSILEVTGAPVPPAVRARAEGINLLPIWEGKAPQVARTLFWRNGMQTAVREGDWKLVNDRNTLMLFDVRHDVSERFDQSNRQQPLVRKLSAAVAAWEQAVDAEAAASGVAPAAGGRGNRGGGRGNGGRAGGARGGANVAPEN